MSRFVVWLMKDVLGDNGREREVCQTLRDRRRRRGAGHRDSQAKILRSSLCATGHCTPTGSRISGRPILHPESQLSTMSSRLLDAPQDGKSVALWRPLGVRSAIRCLPTFGKPATFQHAAGRQRHTSMGQHHRDRDDDHRDVPEQRYARRAAQAVCR